MKQTVEVSIIIINYNTWHLLGPCIESIREHCADVAHEIIVVDNASSDGSVEKIRAAYPEMKLIANDENLGFGRANNQALMLAKGEFVFLLNADTLMLDGNMSKALRFIKEKGVDMLAPKLVSEDLSVQNTYREHCTLFTHMAALLRLTLRVSRFRRRTPRRLVEPARVEFIVGAAMLIRREIVDRHGLFDERFFFTGEEADLCLRYRKAGLSIYYYPEWAIMHLVSSGDPHKCFHVLQYMKSLPMLAGKHAGFAGFVLAKLLTLAYMASNYASFRIKASWGGDYEKTCAQRYLALLMWYFRFRDEQDVYQMDCCGKQVGRN